MHLDRFSTCLLTDDVAKSKAFYVDLFGFETIIDIGWFVSLHASNQLSSASASATTARSPPAFAD